MAVYTCHPGYTPVPRATQSICGRQGSWSQPPVCEGEVTEGGVVGLGTFSADLLSVRWMGLSLPPALGDRAEETEQTPMKPGLETAAD